MEEVGIVPMEVGIVPMEEVCTKDAPYTLEVEALCLVPEPSVQVQVAFTFD